MTAQGLPPPSTLQGPWSSGVQPGKAGRGQAGCSPGLGRRGVRDQDPHARCPLWVPDLGTEPPPCLHQAAPHPLALGPWEA